MQILNTFLSLVFVSYVALFPPVNPIGSAFMVDPFFHGLNFEERKSCARRIAFYCLSLCTAALLTGSWVFKFFGISLPVVQLAGGILICRMGWQMLATGAESKGSDATSTALDKRKDIENILFYPLAFPITTGAGTISVLLTLSARGHSDDLVEYLTNIGAIFASIVLTCISIYICYAYTPTLLKRLGTRGEQVVNGLSAFLVFCVGIQIGFNGLQHLLK